MHFHTNTLLAAAFFAQKNGYYWPFAPIVLKIKSLARPLLQGGARLE
jgi:hypothetical protein